MRKKPGQILFITIVALLLCLPGCYQYEEITLLSEVSPVQSEAITIAFAHKSTNSYFYTVMNESVKRAVEGKGWNYEWSVADYDVARQNQQIIQFMNKNVDAVITSAIDSTQMSDVVALANRLTIPICTIDTDAEAEGMVLEVCFDDFRAGQLAAEVIVEALETKYGEVKGTVFNAYGDQDSSAWRQRKEGFDNIMNRYPDINYIAICTMGQPKETKDETVRLLASQPVVDAIHVSSEHPAQGLVDALQDTDNWYPLGDDKHITIVTIDGGPYFVDFIEERYVDAAIAQDVIAYGNIVTDMLEQYIFKGRDMVSDTYYAPDTYWKTCDIIVDREKSRIVIPPYIINIENCNDETHWSYIAKNEWGFQYNR